MEHNSEYCRSKLDLCKYRYLQQMAKSMNLPSNVKKVQLIEMINAKMCSTESELERIVRRVKIQRQHLKQAKKRGKRACIQIDSESDSPSPPISITPKRPIIVRASDVGLQQVIVQSPASLLRPRPASDRVLRSCNIKPVRQYVSQNVIHQSATFDHGTQMSSMRNVRKYKPKFLNQTCHRQVTPISQMPSSNVIVKRPRLLSGIYPINREFNVQLQSVGVRNGEGKMTKINAFIHKPDTKEKSQQTYSNNMTKNIEITIQDIIDGNLDAQANLQNLNYPNTSGVSESALPSKSTVYYHNKIRSEQVRERRPLPPIQDTFNQFRPDLTQPLYVKVDNDDDTMLNYPFSKRNTNLLETVYNFKSQFLTHQPLLQIATTSNTKCVYSTPTVATAVPHRPATVPYTEPYIPYERANQCQYNSIDSTRMNDLRFAEDYFRCNEEQPHTSSSSVGTISSPELGANVTISDMVEDALELISQDGDYMERMGMDVRMQCVLCSWAGPKIILECHIRKDHSSEIDNQETRDWNISWRLGELVRARGWACRVIQYDAALYVLTARHRAPDTFMATLSSLSTEPDAPSGSITIFNKVTGEPHTWEGEIKELPPNLPYENEAALTVTLSELNLLPNSANLKLVNGELVLQSPSKVVFGQELSDVHVILFVKIFA